MSKHFHSTPASLWNSVSIEYEDTSFHRKDGAYPANSFRYDLIFEFLDSKPKGKILDAGCGPGLMSRMLQKRGWDVVACDYSEGMIEVSKKKAAQEGLADIYHHLSLFELSSLNEKFDYVILNGVLPYVAEEEEEKVFAQIKKILNPGGFLLASHYNLYFDIFGLDKWGVEAIAYSILEPAGLEHSEIEKAKAKILTLIKEPNKVLDKEKTMKLEDPLTYKEKLTRFGFDEFDQAFYNLFYLPAKFEADHNQKIREELERKLRRNPKGLMLYRTFVSFAQLSR